MSLGDARNNNYCDSGNFAGEIPLSLPFLVTIAPDLQVLSLSCHEGRKKNLVLCEKLKKICDQLFEIFENQNFLISIFFVIIS